MAIHREHHQDYFSIGPWIINSPAVLAPMAGVSDLPFRQLCREMGAGLVVSEMLSADTSLWNSRKSSKRLQYGDEETPRAVQIVGYCPTMMAEAAKKHEAMGAQIIDINMGCPAKKVCKKAAGSALLRDEKLVKDILTAIVNAVSVPVTLKIRTGWNPKERNGTRIALIAEDAGIQCLAVHGRTRACAFKGAVEYDTIASIVESVSIPVLANGDITTAQQAKFVLDKTGANAIMIGRGAQGNPWLFREIEHFLKTGEKLAKPTLGERRDVIISHIRALHAFYGELMGLRIARKHVAWYLAHLPASHTTTQPNGCEHKAFRKQFNGIESQQEQYDGILSYFDTLATNKEEKAA